MSYRCIKCGASMPLPTFCPVCSSANRSANYTPPQPNKSYEELLAERESFGSVVAKCPGVPLLVPGSGEKLHHFDGKLDHWGALWGDYFQRFTHMGLASPNGSKLLLKDVYVHIGKLGMSVKEDNPGRFIFWPRSDYVLLIGFANKDTGWNGVETIKPLYKKFLTSLTWPTHEQVQRLIDEY